MRAIRNAERRLVGHALACPFQKESRGYFPVAIKSIVTAAFVIACLHAETGYDAWLRYRPIEGAAMARVRAALPAAIVALGDAEPEVAARGELIQGLRGMTGRTVRAEARIPRESAIVLGTLDELSRAAPQWNLHAQISEDAYWLNTVMDQGTRYIVVTASNPRGVLYGAFARCAKSPRPSSPTRSTSAPRPTRRSAG